MWLLFTSANAIRQSYTVAVCHTMWSPLTCWKRVLSLRIVWQYAAGCFLPLFNASLAWARVTLISLRGLLSLSGISSALTPVSILPRLSEIGGTHKAEERTWKNTKGADRGDTSPSRRDRRWIGRLQPGDSLLKGCFRALDTDIRDCYRLLQELDYTGQTLVKKKGQKCCFKTCTSSYFLSL